MLKRDIVQGAVAGRFVSWRPMVNHRSGPVYYDPRDERLPHSNRPCDLQLWVDDRGPVQPTINHQDRITGKKESPNRSVKLAWSPSLTRDSRDETPGLVEHQRGSGARNDPDPLAFIAQHRDRPVEQHARAAGISKRDQGLKTDATLPARHRVARYDPTLAGGAPRPRLPPGVRVHTRIDGQEQP